MSIHATVHPSAGQSVPIARGYAAGAWITIEDWWDRIAGKSWMACDGNPACLMYAMRSLGDPIDNEVVYGKIDGLGHLIHVTNLCSPPLDDRQP